jgi:hypothetical protein
MFGIQESEPMPGAAVPVIPMSYLNPMWLWQYHDGTVPIVEEGEEQKQDTPK